MNVIVHEFSSVKGQSSGQLCSVLSFTACVVVVVVVVAGASV